MMVIDVTEIYGSIVGYAKVCYPIQDADGKYIMSMTSLNDGLLTGILELLYKCPKITYNPKKNNENFTDYNQFQLLYHYACLDIQNTMTQIKENDSLI